MYSKTYIKKLLEDVRRKKISLKKAYALLKSLPYKNLQFAKIDHHRQMRKGFAEVVYCEGKSPQHLKKILDHVLPKTKYVLLTRATTKLYNHLKQYHPSLKYHESSRIMYVKKRPVKNKKPILILTAGTSDIPVAEEAKLTLEVMGHRTKTIYDVGVAGIHRLFDKLSDISKANVIIVVCGMEGALASVVGGITDKPVIAVPTSIGYGSSFKGIAPLLTMLNSCAPGVSVVNIDNGFGAGYFASLINNP